MQPPNLYPLIDGKLYQAGLVGEAFAFFALHPTIIIDCTHDIAIFEMTAPLFIKVPFNDEPLPIDSMHLITRLHHVARLAAQAIRNGDKILVHCNAGQNRSSLLDGIILLELRAMGLLTFRNTVDFIREKRPGALSNKSFAAYLNGQNGNT